MGKRGRPPSNPPAVKRVKYYDTMMSLQTTKAFRDWLNRFASHERMAATQLMEKAVVEYAERHEYPEKAPPRVISRAAGLPRITRETA